MTGTLVQIGLTAHWAAELFEDLFKNVKAIQNRVQTAQSRVHSLARDLPKAEEATLQLTERQMIEAASREHKSHKKKQTEPQAPPGGYLTKASLPPALAEAYDRCEPPPDFRAIDALLGREPGDCLKSYSNPGFFLDQWAANELAQLQVLKQEKDLRKKERKEKEKSSYNSGEWSMDFDVDRKMEENPENDGNTMLLSSVLDQLLTNPYDVELQRPEFEYHQDDELYMTVRFPVVYRLKDKILKDMLTGLPYTGLEQNGTLTVFYFDRTKFNFPSHHVESIKSGSYRNVPVLRIFDNNRNTLIVVADTPEEYWHGRNSNKVLYVPQHQFSPLIDFTVGGWSIQVAMETVDIQAVYEFIIPVKEMESLSNVSLKFVNENELRQFLDPIL